ncbi:DegV family protein [Niameybacter massiliensis]|uniref:DegV family protein n=1 Tax=Holtiella tumoricola TaxID=3018743 RepID=A0AA42DLP0_9FIRM|nr:DegV family protein [Holtiella tumoricola]MDA3731183.1 DegV family protein [Holtiella tumoricola]
MKKFAVITDSCCDLTFASLQQYDLTMFPIRVIYKEKEYLDKIEISSEEMYSRLHEEVPTTSLPDLHYCENKVHELKEQGYTDFIIITVSSQLSGTLNALRILSEHFPDLNFHFFDSLTLGYPQGVIAMEAGKMAQSGASFEEVLARLEDVRKRTYGYIALDTLEYLKKGGRIGKVTATVGELIKLKPIISSNDDGVLYTYCKVRGKKQSFAKVKEIILSHLDKGKCSIWVLHGDALQGGTDLYEILKGHPNINHLSLEVVGPSMGVHTGPGVVGCAILEEF